MEFVSPVSDDFNSRSRSSVDALVEGAGDGCGDLARSGNHDGEVREGVDGHEYSIETAVGGGHLEAIEVPCVR